MRNQVFKKLFSVLLALIMVAGLLPASAMAGGWGAMDVDTTPELTETEQPTESAEPTAPAETETPEVTEVPEPMPENPAATVESTQGEPTEEITIAPVNEVVAQANGVTTVIAGSDFQNKSGDGSGKVVVQNIIQSMIDGGITSVDGFLFAGDYWIDMIPNKDDTAMLGHVNSLRDAVKEKYTNLTYDNMVCIQGNHDQVTPDPNKNGLSKSGAHDTNAYGVYVINEDDYMWASNASHSSTSYSGMSAEAIVKQTAANLKTYLDAKTAEKYDKPIFVVSHLPLHYSMRTRNDGDCMYANLIFDVLNTAGNNGLNIIFMYGHDHSNGWDDYLGGSCVYLAKGSSINIAQSSQTNFKTETLKFTYMNAGFTGYYENRNSADNTLTMTVFQIYGDRVEVSRYSANGIHKLKCKGVTNQYKGESGYSPDTSIVESPATITLTTVADVPAIVIDGKPVSTCSVDKAKNAELTLSAQNFTGTVTWSSSEETVATVDNGTVTLHKAGTTTITATDGMNSASIELTVTDSNAVKTERTYTRVTSTSDIEDGKQYLIIYNSDTDYFMQPLVKTENNRTGFTLISTTVAEPDEITGKEYINYEWTLTKSGNGWLLGSGDRYAKLTNTGVSNQKVTATLESSGDVFVIDVSADSYTFKSGSYYLNYNSGGFLINGYADNPAHFYIYKLTSEGTTEPVEETRTRRVAVGGTYKDPNQIDGYYPDYEIVDGEGFVNVTVIATNEQVSEPTYVGNKSLTIDENNRPGNSTEWTLSSYLHKKNDTYYPVYYRYYKKDDDKYRYRIAYYNGKNYITLANGKESATQNNLYEKTSDGTTTPASTNVSFTGIQPGVATVKVGHVTYIITVYDKTQLSDYPEYPDPGSVRVEKSGTGVDFQDTGVAKIELSTTGVPMEKGVDVILMLDTSSSMNDEVDGTTRISVLRESVANMLATFNTPNANNTIPDIRIAIADFNGYYYERSDGPLWLDTKDHLTGGSIREGSSNKAQVYTGDKTYTAGAFVDASSYNTDEKRRTLVSSITTSSGTNYDQAFYNAYQLGQAITNTNEEERDLYVVFMSDGAPFQYNGFSSQSGSNNESGAELWNNWLQGTDNNAAEGSHSYFYNGDGNKNRWAEAIKGDTKTQFTVIDKTSTENFGDYKYMKQVNGLGAKMYSIGFCLADDGKITVATMENVLQKIATDTTNYYYNVNTAAGLNRAFTQIASDIKKAGYGAVFTDKMGSEYDLKLTPFDTKDGSSTINPTITVSVYPLYKQSDVDAGIIAKDKIGTRKSDTPNVVETVRFSKDGKQAYSDKVNNGATNILTDDKINAVNFTYDLKNETFTWNVGDITEDEKVLTYYVYLTGSMEGTRSAGSYPTNESAVLNYKNYLDHDAHKDTVSPEMPWKSATVSYAFYLVDVNGNPISSNGTVVPFAEAYRLTQPVVYSKVLLNSGTDIAANVVAKDALPTGYKLYDAAAGYTIRVNSGTGGGSWTIAKGANVAATTYVADYGTTGTTAPTNEVYSNNVNSGNNDYTHTTVWFAVRYIVSAVPDSVVIDFGLPVDISVLANDLLGEGAAVAGVGDVSAITSTTGTNTIAAGFGNTHEGSFGTATVNGSKVCYTPSCMTMNNVDKFAYAAKASDGKYYYSTVTVIPAANIYYEDSFVEFKGEWKPVGNEPNGITQQEDRPGKFSLSAYDANNVYGFDSAYTKCTEYSLGSARKVTVNKTTNDNPPTATFTFTGTGFDLISLTSNTTGTILVDVYNSNEAIGEAAHKWIVDTYYGYMRTDDGYNKYTWTKGEDGKWHVTKEKVDTLPDGAVLDGTPVNSGDVTYSRNYKWAVTKDTDNALYQIPVIRGQGLEYGTYTVVITPMFSSVLDHAGNGRYDFYLDAVRIYDPAGKDPSGEIGDAYAADGEGWPEIIELRNLLIEKKSLTEADSDANGIVFVDGKAAAEVTDYTNFGPNNEVYLAKDQAIAFKLSVADPSNIASIQLAAKSPNGGATAKVNADGTATSIATATEMYYTITHRVTWGSGTDGQSNTIVVANIGNNILSLTNIKITYKQQPTASTQAVAIVDNEVVEQAPAMLLSMMGIKDPESEPEPEPEKTFEPDRFEASWRRNVMQGRKATLTVKTSEDVEAITVDGQTIRSYRTRSERVGFGRRAKRITYREFTYSMVAQESADFSVTAINAEGTESEAITARLTVKTRPNSMRDMWDWFKGWF